MIQYYTSRSSIYKKMNWRGLSCPLDSNKSAFIRVGRTAPSDFISQLIYTKYFPVLYHGLDACPLHMSQFNSITLSLIVQLKKLFDIYSQEIVDTC